MWIRYIWSNQKGPTIMVGPKKQITLKPLSIYMTSINEPQSLQPKAPVTDSLADTIRSEICRGRYQPGDKLLAERDLAKRYQANRSTVREALKILNSEGFISLRGRGGAIVQAADKVSLGAVHHLLFVDGDPNLPLISEFLHVHRTLVFGAIELAVKNAGDDEIQRAKTLVQRLVEITQGQPSLERTSLEEFSLICHKLMGIITQNSNNTILRIIYGTINRSVLSDFQKLGQRQPRRLSPSMSGNFAKIIQLLEKRDSDAIVSVVKETFTDDWLND